MPCNSDYLLADSFEKSLSQVACLLNELDGKSWSRAWWNGYHPDVYCKNLDKQAADEMVARLCGQLCSCDATQYSLEMQIWWRDHQKADKAREVKHQSGNP